MSAVADREPSVSVVIPTHNRRELLRRLLGALAPLYASGPRFEVVVVIDGSRDGTDQMLDGLAPPYPLHAISTPHQGQGAARNAGIAAARGDVLLFVDDDVVPQAGLVQHHLAIHATDPSAVVVGRIARPLTRATPPWHHWEAHTLMRRYAAIGSGVMADGWRSFFTGNASVRREHAVAVGGFDETLVRAEDVEFAHRLAEYGLRFHFAPIALVHHEDVDRTLPEWLRLAFEYGRHDVVVERRFGVDGAGLMQERWRHKNALNRRLAQWCVGHTSRTRLVVDALTHAVTYARPAPRRLQFLLCTALFNVEYWTGVAEATGLGARLWDGFIASPGTDGATTNARSAAP